MWEIKAKEPSIHWEIGENIVLTKVLQRIILYENFSRRRRTCFLKMLFTLCNRSLNILPEMSTVLVILAKEHSLFYVCGFLCNWVNGIMLQFMPYWKFLTELMLQLADVTEPMQCNSKVELPCTQQSFTCRRKSFPCYCRQSFITLINFYTINFWKRNATCFIWLFKSVCVKLHFPWDLFLFLVTCCTVVVKNLTWSLKVTPKENLFIPSSQTLTVSQL